MESKSKIYRVLSSLNGIKWSMALKGVACGIAAGFLVILYRQGIEWGS